MGLAANSLLGVCPVSAQTITAEAPSRAVEEGGPARSEDAHEDLDALVWTRTSAEYRAITLQVYRAALAQLPQAVKDPTWNAISDDNVEEARGDEEARGVAVILDVDETVLDNSAYQVQLIENSQEFDGETWNDFVRAQVSTAIPGATEFVEGCRAAGVSVFFVTNRHHRVKRETRANLETVGLLQPAQADAVDRLLCKEEQPSWTSDKSTRRAYIAKAHRVVMLFGDDLNDFVSVGQRPSSEKRLALGEQYRRYWGRQWFVLPNANYGGWERATYHFQDKLPRGEKLRRKRSAMGNHSAP